MIIITFRDLFNRKRILYAGVSALAALVLTYNYNVVFSQKSFLMSIGIITFLSTMQIYFSYFMKERVIDYYQLPMKTNHFYLSLMGCIFLNNLVERILIICIIFYRYLLLHPIDFIVCLVYSGYVIGICFLIFVLLQSSDYILLKCIKFTLYFLVGGLPILMPGTSVLFIIILILLNKINHLVFTSQKEKIYITTVRNNYFLTSLVSDGAFYLNLVFILFFSVYLLFQQVNVHIVIPMVFSVISLNSSLMTLISADRGTLNQIKLLPHSIILLMMYFRLLLIYFMVLNGFVFCITIYFDILPLAPVTLGYIILLVLFEALFSVFIEIYFPLTKWHLKKDMWKNPRKYILACIVYFITFCASFFF